jgi:hypothetical protein
MKLHIEVGEYCYNVRTVRPVWNFVRQFVKKSTDKSVVEISRKVVNNLERILMIAEQKV